MRYLLQNLAINNAVASMTTINGSYVVTVASTTGIAAIATKNNQGETGRIYVSGTGIPADTYIVSIDSATQITLSQKATASGTVTLTFWTQFSHDGSVPLIVAWATAFGGGTITIQCSPDNGVTWIGLSKETGTTLAAATFTANSTAVLYKFPMGFLIRALLSGASGASGVNCALGI